MKSTRCYLDVLLRGILPWLVPLRIKVRNVRPHFERGDCEYQPIEANKMATTVSKYLPNQPAIIGLLVCSLTTPGVVNAVFAPEGLNPGDIYHLAFVTDATRDATSTNINDYNAFVQAQAALNPTLTGTDDGVVWTAIASTSTIAAIDNAPITGPVYRLDGQLLAQDGNDFWDGTREAGLNITQFLDAYGEEQFAWTGSSANGDQADVLGGTLPWVAHTIDAGPGGLGAGVDFTPTVHHPLYALSGPIQVPLVDSDFQIVTPSPAAISARVSQQIAVDAIYTTDPTNEMLPGFGFRVHYDSSQLIFDELTDVLPTALIGNQSGLPDTDNEDDDPATDMIIIFAWADLDGNWPGVATTPVSLASLSFTTSNAFTGTTIRFSNNGTAAGQTFASTPLVVCLDTEGDGECNTTDTDDDGDGMPDDWEIANGLNPLDDTDANTDADGDDIANIDEYLAGTDPQDSSDPGLGVVASGDLNGDLTADLLMRNTVSHRWFAYMMDGRTIVDKGSITATRNASWEIVANTDINGDGKVDILLRNSSSGKWYTYLMDGRTVIEKGPITAAVRASWQIVAITDLNGDDKSDILLRNSGTGKWFGYLLDGRTVIAKGSIAANAFMGWETVKISDQNGDGNSDILLRNSVTHRWISYLLDGLTVIDNGSVAMTTNPDWEVVAATDLNADSTADMLMRNRVSGGWFGYLLDGRTVLQKGSIKATRNHDWEIASISDLDADGKADILLRNALSKRWFGYLLDGINLPVSGPISASRDPLWELVSTQDLDADGTTDIVLRNSSNGRWFGYLMNGLMAHEKGKIGATIDQNWQVVKP